MVTPSSIVSTAVLLGLSLQAAQLEATLKYASLFDTQSTSSESEQKTDLASVMLSSLIHAEQNTPLLLHTTHRLLKCSRSPRTLLRSSGTSLSTTVARKLLATGSRRKKLTLSSGRRRIPSPRSRPLKLGATSLSRDSSISSESALRTKLASVDRLSLHELALSELKLAPRTTSALSTR